MAHKNIDRCKETTSTTGTGTLTLAGAVPGFVTVANATNGLTANGDTGWFEAINGTEWEIFLGTRVDATHLARTTVISSSNAGAAVSFTAAPTVFSTVPGVNVATVGPAFSAYRGTSNQSVTTGATTKVQLNAEEFDTAACFDSTTNYRFTPNVAGYYAVNFSVNAGCASAMTALFCNLQKNGVNLAYGTYASPVAASEAIAVGSKIVYLNGTTDYLELHANVAATTPVLKFGLDRTFLSAHFIRGA